MTLLAKPESFVDPLLPAAKPDLYLNNIFRRTGLSVLAGRREVAKRLDLLGLELELGTAAQAWSMAPTDPLTQPELREISQLFNDSTLRLYHEFFWFWPLSYPHPAPDRALEGLAAGNTRQALDEWHGLAEEAHSAAVHNLAVYYHFLALDLERVHAPSEALLKRMWNKTLGFWQLVLSDERLWSAFEDRIRDLQDAQIPAEWLREFRETLPESFSRINAAMARKHAERGNLELASQNAAFVRTILPDANRAQSILEAEAAPFVRRIDGRLREAQQVSARQGKQDLSSIATLIKNCEEDLVLVETLCRPSLNLYTEVATRLVDTAIYNIIAYQRDTYDNRGCLAIIDELLGLRGNEEIRQKLQDTRTVMIANLQTDEGTIVAFDSSDFFQSAVEDHQASLKNVIENVIPALARRGTSGRPLPNDAARLRVFLTRFAQEIFRKKRAAATAVTALKAALDLAESAEERQSIQAQITESETYLTSAKEKSTVITVDGRQLKIDHTGVHWEDRFYPITTITGFRHAIYTQSKDRGSPDLFLAAWKSSARETELTNDNFFGSASDPEGTYNRIIEASYFFVVPSLIDRAAALIRSGRSVPIGNLLLEAEGVQFASRTMLRRKTTLIPYVRIQCALDHGQVNVSAREAPHVSESLAIGDTWNAVILSRLIEKLVT